MGKELSATVKFDQLHRITCVWAAELSPTEVAVVSFIWWRTANWNKQYEVITAQQFLHGVRDTQTGKVRHAGLQISPRTLTRTLADLSKKGLVKRSYNKNTGTSTYGLDLTWSPDKMREPKNKKNPVNNGMKTPKRGGSQIGEGGVAKLARGGSQIGEQKSVLIKSVQEKSIRGSKPPQQQTGEEEISKSLAEASNRSATARERKKAAALKRESVRDLEYLWSAAVRKHHPDALLPVWNVKTCGMVKRFRDAWKAQGHGQLWPFLNFAIANWHRIGKLRFDWLTKPYPETPDVNFIIGFKKDFAAAKVDELFFERQVGASKADRKFEKFKRMGMTDEQAAARLENEGTGNKALQKANQRAAAAERDAQAAKAERKRAELQVDKMRAEQGRKILADERRAADEDLQRGAKTKNKKTVKRDKDGFAVFEG